MAPARAILNLWYVVDGDGMITSLRGRAYPATGVSRDDRLELQHCRYVDYVVARSFGVPERFCTGDGPKAPLSVLEGLESEKELFEEVIGALEEELSAGGGSSVGEKPRVCITHLEVDEEGQVSPAGQQSDAPAPPSLRDGMREGFEWMLEKTSFGHFSDILDDIYVLRGTLWGEVPDASGVSYVIDLSGDLRGEIGQALDAAWGAYAGGSPQDQRVALGKLWRAYRQLASGEDLGNIFKAVKAGDLRKTGNILAAYPAEVGSEDDDSWTPLHWAAFEENVEMAQILLDKGARADAQAWEGVDELAAESPLHIAVRFGHVEMAELLLRHGALLETRDETGAAALAVAAQEGNTELAKFLLEKGADPGAVDERDRTPLDLAKAKCPGSDVIPLLEAGEAGK